MSNPLQTLDVRQSALRGALTTVTSVAVDKHNRLRDQPLDLPHVDATLGGNGAIIDAGRRGGADKRPASAAEVPRSPRAFSWRLRRSHRTLHASSGRRGMRSGMSDQWRAAFNRLGDLDMRDRHPAPAIFANPEGRSTRERPCSSVMNADHQIRSGERTMVKSAATRARAAYPSAIYCSGTMPERLPAMRLRIVAPP